MIQREYELVSIEEHGKEYVEGTFTNEQDAFRYADNLANTYSYMSRQDFNVGTRIAKITVRPVWNLEK